MCANKLLEQAIRMKPDQKIVNSFALVRFYTSIEITMTLYIFLQIIIYADPKVYKKLGQLAYVPVGLSRLPYSKVNLL